MSIDLADSLTPFTLEQIRLLKRFVTQVDKLSTSQFLKDSTEPIELKAEFLNGQVDNLRLVGPEGELLTLSVEHSANYTEVEREIVLPPKPSPR
jgi:hypothetical protein